jgi:hypothetical protein
MSPAVNHALHMAAVVQLWHKTEGKAYWRRANWLPAPDREAYLVLRLDRNAPSHDLL